MATVLATQKQVNAYFKKSLKAYNRVCTTGLIRKFSNRGLTVTGHLMDTAAKEVMGGYEYSNCIYQQPGTGARLREFLSSTGFTGSY